MEADRLIRGGGDGGRFGRVLGAGIGDARRTGPRRGELGSEVGDLR